MLTYKAWESFFELKFDSTVFRISLRKHYDFVNVDEINLSNTGSTTISDTDRYNERNGHNLYGQDKSYPRKVYPLKPSCHK